MVVLIKPNGEKELLEISKEDFSTETIKQILKGNYAVRPFFNDVLFYNVEGRAKGFKRNEWLKKYAEQFDPLIADEVICGDVLFVSSEINDGL